MSTSETIRSRRDFRSARRNWRHWPPSCSRPAAGPVTTARRRPPRWRRGASVPDATAVTSAAATASGVSHPVTTARRVRAVPSRAQPAPTSPAGSYSAADGSRRAPWGEAGHHAHRRRACCGRMEPIQTIPAVPLLHVCGADGNRPDDPGRPGRRSAYRSRRRKPLTAPGLSDRAPAIPDLGSQRAAAIPGQDGDEANYYFTSAARTLTRPFRGSPTSTRSSTSTRSAPTSRSCARPSTASR